MRNTSANSWLQSTARVATIGIALLAGETTQAEQPANPAEKSAARIEAKPYNEQTEEMRKSTLARVIELLGPTHSENDAERMKGLNTLEAELIPLGNTKMLDDTRKLIIQELKIDALEKTLNKEKESEESETIDALMRLREHENHFIRNRVERLFTQHFKEKPGKDPRYKPPDIRHMTRHLTGEMVGSVEELQTSKSIEALRTEVRKTIAQWKSNDYKQRELARKQIGRLVRETKGMIGIEEILREELTPKLDGKYWVGNWNDLEVRKSAEVCLQTGNEKFTTETLYPPLQSTVGQVLSDMRKYGGMHIRFGEAQTDAVNMLPVISAAPMTHAQLLTRICDITGTYPMPNGHPHDLTLIAQGKNLRTLLPLQGAILVTDQPEQEQQKRTAYLLTDPQSAIVNMEQATMNDETAIPTDIKVSDGDMTAWKFTSTKSDLAKLSVPNTGTGNPGSLRVQGWIGSAPASFKKPLNDEKMFGTIGSQEIGIMREKDTVTCSNAVFGDLPWPKTPCASDMHAYALSRSTRIAFLSSKGEVLEMQPGQVTVSERTITWNVTSPQKPETVEVRGYQDLHQEEITWDLKTGEIRRKILKPCIDVNH